LPNAPDRPIEPFGPFTQDFGEHSFKTQSVYNYNKYMYIIIIICRLQAKTFD